jgi:hypothetical protein
MSFSIQNHIVNWRYWSTLHFNNPTLNPFNPIPNPLNPTLNPLHPTLTPLNPLNPPLNSLNPLNPTPNPRNPTVNPLNTSRYPLIPALKRLKPTATPLNSTLIHLIHSHVLPDTREPVAHLLQEVPLCMRGARHPWGSEIDFPVKTFRILCL